MQRLTWVLLFVIIALGTMAADRQKLNFNGGWLLQVGDVAEARQAAFDDAAWQQVTLPFAFNGHEAFKRDIVDLTDTIAWYRKHNSRYQWNDRNFNANYGGIPKNVFLHLTGRVYQTLPLYSNLGTTGTYVYAGDFDRLKAAPGKVELRIVEIDILEFIQ